MDNFEGTLLVPPDRGQILGRAVWKPRYVIVGRRPTTFPREHQSSPSYSGLMSASRIVNSSSKSSPKALMDEPSIAIFKSKDETEPIQQWPISCVVDCQVQMLAKRKQSHVLPTLVITLSDKERKRRSSRAGSLLPANKDSSSTSLWFRSTPEEPYPTLQDWARYIMSRKRPMSPDESPITPTSSVTFSPRQRDASDYFPRPGSGPANRSLHHKSSNATYSSGAKERPTTFSSESPSLRSKRSDLSSPSSNFPGSHQVNFGVPSQYYTTVLPTDLPSPVTTTGDYHRDFIEGWTSAQGRTSTMSSPVQGRDSISYHAHKTSLTSSSSPPMPRETILDRAFQMRSMSASEQILPGEEKLSSVARFDALMRDMDEKRKQREAAERSENLAMRSAFEADDSSNTDDSEDTDSDDGNFAPREGQYQPPLVAPSTHRTIGELPSSSRPGMSRQNLSFHAKATPNSVLQESIHRPQSANEKNRRGSQRAQSTQFLTSPSGAELAAAASGKLPEDALMRLSGDHRQSISSAKRLSFTEFTKRLSSTSSLLLVQTNASGGSSRRSSEIDTNQASVPRTNLKAHYQGPGPRERNRIRDDQEKRCSWRGGIGVEGGFF
ncbi:unnamed protein product [Clonostachys rosea f. rosea IK726]|uniref:Uncharacterized protein n=2 Tax=Bionectria ochroleuca TaxID=29856 RepID=A0A0B7JR94_BIOOC|nr:unnamed protein product [Clonostachys rosea f. rosea IK726]